MTNDLTTEQKLDSRLVVLLTDDTKHALKVKAANERREMSDIVRDLITEYLSKPADGPLPKSKAFNVCRLCYQVIPPEDVENPGGDGLVVEINPLSGRLASMHQICLQMAIDDLAPEARDRYNSNVSK